MRIFVIVAIISLGLLGCRMNDVERGGAFPAGAGGTSDGQRLGVDDPPMGTGTGTGAGGIDTGGTSTGADVPPPTVP